MTDVIALLRAALGDAVSTDSDVLAAARGDKSGQRTTAPPRAVITARSVEHVQIALRIAHDRRGARRARGGREIGRAHV